MSDSIPHDDATDKVDFAAVDSREKALTLHQIGKLETLLLFPSRFGGKDDPTNTVFAPSAAVNQKTQIDEHIIPALVKARLISNYEAKIKREGTSVVPSSITILASGTENFQFVINIWGEPVEQEQKLWDEVYAKREQVYAQYFGPIVGDVHKLMNLTGVWPGGCLVQIESATNRLVVTSSFGLTNPDMPTQIALAAAEQISSPDGKVTEFKSTLVSRPPRPIPIGCAGYGYEILVLTRKAERWPLMFLNWAVQAEILNDANLLGRVRKNGAMTIEEAPLADGYSPDFLIAPIQRLAPPTIELPNGSIELLVATMITRADLEFGMKMGGAALLDRLKSSEEGQISAIDSPESKPGFFGRLFGGRR